MNRKRHFEIQLLKASLSHAVTSHHNVIHVFSIEMLDEHERQFENNGA